MSHQNQTEAIRGESIHKHRQKVGGKEIKNIFASVLLGPVPETSV